LCGGSILEQKIGVWFLRGKGKEASVKNGGLKEQRPAWPLLVGLMLATLLAVVSCSAFGKQGAKAPAGDGSQASVDLKHPSLGEENAPVVLTEYADYQ
jgi:hypothetical protein